MAGYWPSYLFRFYGPRRSNSMQQGVQTEATCYIKQCWRLLANNVASLYTGLNQSTNPSRDFKGLQYSTGGPS